MLHFFLSAASYWLSKGTYGRTHLREKNCSNNPKYGSLKFAKGYSWVHNVWLANDNIQETKHVWLTRVWKNMGALIFTIYVY